MRITPSKKLEKLIWTVSTRTEPRVAAAIFQGSAQTAGGQIQKDTGYHGFFEVLPGGGALCGLAR